MTHSPFNDFLNTLDFGDITGPTKAEERHDALEQRDLAQRLTALLDAGVVDTLHGSTAEERSAWRDGVDFAVGILTPRYGAGGRNDADPAYELTRVHLYAVFIKSICAAYRCIDVSVVNAAVNAILALYACDMEPEIADAWQSNVRPVPIAQDKLVYMAMQAAYIYSDLHPAAMLH